MQVTVARRTAFDCLACFEPDEALDLWAWLTTRQVLEHGDLTTEVVRRKGWHGTPKLARLEGLTRTGAVSPAELQLHILLSAAQITRWEAGVRLFDADGLIGVVDVCFPFDRVVIEVDGFRAYAVGKSVADFERERRRANRLSLAGYLVLHTTWDRLVNHPEQVIAEIRQALSTRP